MQRREGQASERRAGKASGSGGGNGERGAGVGGFGKSNVALSQRRGLIGFCCFKEARLPLTTRTPTFAQKNIDLDLAWRVLELAEEHKVLMPHRAPPLVHIFMAHHDLEAALRLLRLGHSLGHRPVAGVQLNLIRMLLTEGRLDLCHRLYRGFPRVGGEHNSRSTLEVRSRRLATVCVCCSVGPPLLSAAWPPPRPYSWLLPHPGRISTSACASFTSCWQPKDRRRR